MQDGSGSFIAYKHPNCDLVIVGDDIVLKILGKPDTVIVTSAEIADKSYKKLVTNRIADAFRFS